MSFGGHQSIFKIRVQPHNPHSVNSQGRFSTRWANTGASLFTPGIGQVEIYISLLQVHGAVPQGQVLFGQSVALRKVRLVDASLHLCSIFHCVWLTALSFCANLPKKTRTFMFNGARPCIIFKFMFRNYKFCAVQQNKTSWRFSSEWMWFVEQKKKWPRALHLSTGLYQCFYTCDTVQCHENNSISCFVEAIVGRKQICVPRKEKRPFFMGIIEIWIQEPNSSGNTEEGLAITNEYALLMALFIFSGLI